MRPGFSTCDADDGGAALVVALQRGILEVRPGLLYPGREVHRVGEAVPEPGARGGFGPVVDGVVGDGSDRSPGAVTMPLPLAIPHDRQPPEDGEVEVSPRAAHVVPLDRQDLRAHDGVRARRVARADEREVVEEREERARDLSPEGAPLDLVRVPDVGRKEIRAERPASPRGAASRRAPTTSVGPSRPTRDPSSNR